MAKVQENTLDLDNSTVFWKQYKEKCIILILDYNAQIINLITALIISFSIQTIKGIFYKKDFGLIWSIANSKETNFYLTQQVLSIYYMPTAVRKVV